MRKPTGCSRGGGRMGAAECAPTDPAGLRTWLRSGRARVCSRAASQLRPGNKLLYSTVPGQVVTCRMHFSLTVCQVGEELPGAFLPRKSHSRGWEEAHAAGQPWPPGAGGRSGRTEVLIKGAVLLLFPTPPRHSSKAALPASPWEGALPTGCMLTWLERAVNHAETWHVWHYPPCLLDTEPPSGLFLKVPRWPCCLPCVRCGLLGSPPSPPGQHVPPCPQQLPVGAARPCSQAPAVLRGARGGHLQPLLLFPGLLQARGASLAPRSVRAFRAMPPPPRLLHAAGQPPHTASGAWAHLPCAPAPASPIQSFTARTGAWGRWAQL